MKMWAGRFGETPDAHFADWQRSFPLDRRLLPFEVRASRAWAEELRNCGVLDAAELAAISAGLDELLRAGMPADDPDIEDVHHFVESALARKLGDVAYKLHTGRSRNEQIATDLRLFVIEQAGHLRQAIADLAEALLDRAERAGDAVMPAYTHGQRAEPVLTAHWLLAYVEMLLRDAARMRECADRAAECPLGSGAVAGSLVAVDRAALARKLGFARPTANSMDATGDRDFAIEFVQGCSILAVHLSRMAEEFVIFASQEYGFLRLPEMFSTGSSAMPHKQNPDALELVRAKSARITGHSLSLLMMVKALPLSYNKDLQETQRPLLESADESLAATRIMAGFVRAVQFDHGRMRQAAGSGFLNAFAAAAYLASTGVPFRKAHERVGSAVRVALERNKELHELSAEELNGCGIHVDLDAFRARLNVAAVLDAHDVPGGTAPARVRAALRAARTGVSELREVAHASP